MKRRFFLRLVAFFRRDQLDRDLSAEISSHINLATEENLQRGMSPEEARRRALIQFGGRQQALESAREQRSLPFLETFFQDTRFSLRLLAKSPGFTLVALFTLALGIGATTSIFSVVYGVLLRPLPYRRAQQIVRVWEQNSTGGRMNVADPNFTDMRAQSQSLAGLAEFNSDIVSVSGHGEPSRTPVASVSADFLQVMGVQPIFGRAFVPEEQRVDAPIAALVSYSFWQQSLGATRDLSSASLKVGHQPASVVGVLPPGFNFPDNAEIWMPRELYEMLPSRTAHNSNVIGRLRDGATVIQARSELTTIAQRLKQQYGQDTAMVAVAIEPLREAMTSNVRPVLLIILVASGFLLLIACANVTNLMLAQAAGRERELAIRAALGAQHYRLLRQFLTEALLLSLIGGALGVLLAYWGLNGLLALAPENLPRLADVSLNLPVLFFSLALVFLVSIALAVFTSYRPGSPDSRDALQEGSRGGIGTVRKQRIGRLLAAGQLATALVLLVGASLLGRSLLRVLSVNSGFHTDGIVCMDLAMPDESTKTSRVEFFDRLFAQLRQLRGVQEVGGTDELPLSRSGFADGSYVLMNAGQLSQHTRDLIQRSVDADFQKDPALLAELTTWFEGLFHDKPALGYADYIVASDGFFKALDIPLLKGRMFDARDTIDASHVALISQSAANDRWPGQDPLGQTIEFGNMDGDLRLLTIVGVVGDVRDHSLEAAAVPTVYVDYRQRPLGTRRFTVVIRSSGKPDNIISSTRAVLHGLDPNLPPRFRTLSQVYSASLQARRFSLTLVGIFSVAAFLLALAGVYGVISYSVAQRTREIGVRMALGANAFQVLAMVLKQGALTGAIGIAAGLLGSFALTRLLKSQLFEVSPTDPLTLLGVSLVLLLVSLSACWIPGRRATRIDPILALRCE
jgi:putative ABC transport system permease protein